MRNIELVTFIAAIVFTMVILNVFIEFQTAGALESVEYSSEKFGNSLRTQTFALHVINNEESIEPGTFDKSDFSSFSSNCPEVDLDFAGSDTPIKMETGLNPCSNSDKIQNPVVVGIETVDGGDSSVEKTVFR
jgi:hypothetical protein